MTDKTLTERIEALKMSFKNEKTIDYRRLETKDPVALSHIDLPDLAVWIFMCNNLPDTDGENLIEVFLDWVRKNDPNIMTLV